MNNFLSEDWLARLQNLSTLWVGFSGGLDSTVLLYNLYLHRADLPPIKALYVHHGLSSKADAWQVYCENWCQKLSLPLVCHSVEFVKNANIEAHARAARYAVFAAQVKPGDALLLGHHLDDQAETLLLQLFRGAGVDGLSSMSEDMPFEQGVLLRPFLNFSKEQLKSFAEIHQLDWIEDESNDEIKYSRNYLRHIIFPALKEKWPGVVGNIARSAQHCQHARLSQDLLAVKDLPGVVFSKSSINIQSLKDMEPYRAINCLRFWLKQNKIRLPSAKTIERLFFELVKARKDASPEVLWDKNCVRRYQNTLLLEKKDISLSLPASIPWVDFPRSLKIDGLGLLKVIGSPVPGRMEVRFRSFGETFFWHGQRKSLKKLFQQWKIPPWQRSRIPLLYRDNELIGVIGYALVDALKDLQIKIVSEENVSVNSALSEPRFLQAFSTKIRVTAPASGAAREVVEKLRHIDLDLDIPAGLQSKTFFHANTDENRFKQLQAALSDDSSSIIWALRGGYGSARLLEKLQTSPYIVQEKKVIGFSDITALHLFLSQIWHWFPIHGSGIAQILDANQDPKNYLRLADILTQKNGQFEALTDLIPFNSLAEKASPQGRLTGGNLTIIASGMGTFWQMQGKDKIIFLEDVGEKGYRLDRALQQLQQNGVFADANALIFGEFIGPEEQEIAYALLRFAEEISIPVYKSMQFGHGRKNYPLVYNSLSTISFSKDAKNYVLTMNL